MNSADCALIIFLKAPQVGAVKTRLAAALGAPAATAAYRRMVETLLTGLHRLENVELRHTPDDAVRELVDWQRPGWRMARQGSGDLGTRLQRAFQESFGAGRQRVVIIGSDCPYVRAADIEEAWNALAMVDVVIGPARDGGYWLIGLRSEQPDLFTDIPWSTDDVLAQTLQRCQAQALAVTELRELVDIDTVEQWREFVADDAGTV
jgi:rSAM/selenodomain-associated transferase 1